MRRLALLLVAAAVLAGCGGGSSGTSETKQFLIVVDAPFSRTPFIGETIADGVGLSVLTLKGVVSGQTFWEFKVEKLDNALSAAQSVKNVRRAVDEHAAVIVTDGTGVDAAWKIAADANIPLIVTYDGAEGLVDPVKRTNVFRIAPTNRGVALRLAEYMIPKRYKIGLLVDDSQYGQGALPSLRRAFGQNPGAVAVRETLPSGASDLSPQVLRARRAGATALLVWAEPGTIANVVIAARTAGWNVPVFTPPSGEDPLLRQQLADHRDWLAGITFAAGRMTAELGPRDFLAFQTAFEAQYGPQLVGVKTRAGRKVAQPPDYAMYSYDAMNVVAAALTRADGPGKQLLAQMNQAEARGANGDQRGFNQVNHEGVVDDDIYFGKFTADFTHVPVKDDPLSKTLPVIEQRR